MLAALFMVVLAGSLGMGVRAQTIRIKLVNGKNGHPMTGACVNVWVGMEQKGAMAIPTDKDGIASVRLTDRASAINAQSFGTSCRGLGLINPVVKYADSIRVNAGYVLCVPHGTNYSWLAIQKFSTKEVLQSGVVTPNVCGKATALPEPGEVILFVRPLNLWEKLKQ